MEQGLYGMEQGLYGTEQGLYGTEQGLYGTSRKGGAGDGRGRDGSVAAVRPISSSSTGGCSCVSDLVFFGLHLCIIRIQRQKSDYEGMSQQDMYSRGQK